MMNLSTLIELSTDAGVDVFSEDNANVFLVKSVTFEISPYIYKVGFQGYSRIDEFPDDLLDLLDEESKEICPFDVDAQASLYGDLNMHGSLSDVRDYIYQHAKPLSRMLVEHLGSVARYEPFRNLGEWYIPLRQDADLGLANYLRRNIPDSQAVVSQLSEYALTKPKLN